VIDIRVRAASWTSKSRSRLETVTSEVGVYLVCSDPAVLDYWKT